MAKRFGRNQKRKLQEQVYRAQYLQAMGEREAYGLRREFARLAALVEEWERRIRSQLGEYSSFLSEPARVEVRYFLEKIPRPVDLSAIMRMPSTPSEVLETMEYITLRLFAVLPREDMNRLAHNVQFVQVNPHGGTVREVLAGYNIAFDAFYQADPEYLAEHIGKEFARYLTKNKEPRNAKV